MTPQLLIIISSPQPARCPPANMLSSGYRRGECSEGFLRLSPCLTTSSGLLTPPSSYSVDARRNSTASTLSSLGPPTPIYGRNSFPDHNYAAVAAIDECQDESMEAMAMDYSFKAPEPESVSFDGWSTMAHSSGLDHSLPLRMHDNFASHQSLAQVHMATYASVDNSASSLLSSCNSTFDNVPYTDFGGHLNNGTASMNNSENIQPIWSYQYAMEHMMSAPTMAPSEALLGGEYIQVKSGEPDTDMGAYDDTDVPLPLSPQEVIVKHEDQMSEDERRVRRSIFVSPTGGKTVKREQQGRSLKRKAKRSGLRPGTVFTDGRRFVIELDNDVEQIPGTRQWRKNGGGPSGTPHICSIEVDQKPCGRKFRRQEHLHRHEKTHSGKKDFVCQLCTRRFNRNDNCWEHYWTHVRRPNKKDGRNTKKSLRRVLTYISDPKHVEKLHNKWKKEVGYEYDPEGEPEEEETDDDIPSPALVMEEDELSNPYMSPSAMKQEDCVIRCRL